MSQIYNLSPPILTLLSSWSLIAWLVSEFNKTQWTLALGIRENSYTSLSAVALVGVFCKPVRCSGWRSAHTASSQGRRKVEPPKVFKLNPPKAANPCTSVVILRPWQSALLDNCVVRTSFKMSVCRYRLCTWEWNWTGVAITTGEETGSWERKQ